MMYVSQIITLYTLNLYSAVSYLNKTERRKIKKRKSKMKEKICLGSFQSMFCRTVCDPRTFQMAYRVKLFL